MLLVRLYHPYIFADNIRTLYIDRSMNDQDEENDDPWFWY